ncbi:MAG: ABC transporter permease [Anaerolineae bacterium]|nr:ABC transporter permease [Anaerolineae bacterium]
MTLNPIAHEVRASYAFVERNFNLIKRYRWWEAVWIMYGIANALAVTYIGAGMGALTGQVLDTSFLVLYLLIGTVVWRYLSIMFDSIGEMIMWERWEGTIEYTMMAPVHRLTHLVGQTLFSILYGLFHAALILLAVAFFFHIDLSQANFGAALVVLMAGSISFIGVGIIAAVLPMLYPERGAQMINFAQALFLLASGIYYPVSVLPAWLQPISALSPATYALEGIRAALLQGASLASLLPTVGVLTLTGLITIPLGVVVFNWGERYAKRTGKLKRNG